MHGGTYGLREVAGEHARKRRGAVSVEMDEYLSRGVHDPAVVAAVARRTDDREERSVGGRLAQGADQVSVRGQGQLAGQADASRGCVAFGLSAGT